MGDPIPSQERFVDAYAEYNSNAINALTRISGYGYDCLLLREPIDVIINDSTSLVVLAGRAIKDDVLIEITNNLTLDFTDSDYYVLPSAPEPDETGYYYIVLSYRYQNKMWPPNEMSIQIIKPSQRVALYNTTNYLFLKCAYLDSTTNIATLFDYDPEDTSIQRVYARHRHHPFDIVENDTTYTYNVAGDITRVDYENGRNIRFTYDAVGDIITETYYHVNVILYYINYTYNAAGDIISHDSIDSNTQTGIEYS